MADEGKPGEPREFKAVWAADEDWKKNRTDHSTQEARWSLRLFRKIQRRFEETSLRVEEEPLPWRMRIHRLPVCAMRSLPLIALLTLTYWALILMLALILSHDFSYMKSPKHWLDLAWMTAVLSVLTGYREARYPEAVLKPSLKHLLQYLRSNWLLFVPLAGLIAWVGIDTRENSEPIAFQVYAIGFIMLAIFWISDLVAYKPVKQNEAE